MWPYRTNAMLKFNKTSADLRDAAVQPVNTVVLAHAPAEVQDSETADGLGVPL